jgi:hypothetical protein
LHPAYQVLLCVAALVLPALGFAIGAILYSAAHYRFLVLVVLFAVLGGYGTATAIRYALKCRIALWPDRIEIRNARRTVEIRRRDIVGYRRINSLRLLFWGRVPHRLTYISRFLRSDAELDRWIDSLPRYGAMLKLGETHDASSDRSLGPTRAERLARLRSAKIIETTSAMIGLGVAFWAWLYPVPYAWALLAAAAFPWIQLLVERLSGTNRFFGPRRWRMSLAVVFFWFSGLFIVCPSPLIISDVYQAEPTRTMALGLVGGGVLAAILMRWDVRLRRTCRVVAGTLIGACLYAGGSLYAANVALDGSKPEIVNVEVTGKNVRHSAHGDRWNLRLGLPRGKRLYRWIAVSKAFYDATSRGQFVCVHRHPGALGVPWMTVDDCMNRELE